ncbi:MAG: hypothetical protein RL683_1054, partial [Actinomycetota bacterium]
MELVVARKKSDQVNPEVEAVETPAVDKPKSTRARKPKTEKVPKAEASTEA